MYRLLLEKVDVLVEKNEKRFIIAFKPKIIKSIRPIGTTLYPGVHQMVKITLCATDEVLILRF